jgi:hypothetical protein
MRITHSAIAALSAAMLAFTLLACESKTDVDFSIVPVVGPSGEYQYINLNRKGRVVIEPQFGEAYIFRDGLALVKTSGVNGKYGYINKNGEFVIAPIFTYAQNFYEGTAWVQMENNQPMLIDKKGEILLQVDSLIKAHPFNKDISTVFHANSDENSKEKILGMFINKKGERVVTTTEGKFNTIINDDLYAFKSEGSEKWGYKNKKGEFAINEQFDFAGPFINEVAVVKVGNKWGSINKKGNFIVTPQYYDMLTYDSDGLYFTKVGKKYGWINEKGETIINPNFDNVSPFYGNKITPVLIGSKWAYIDRKGQIIINPQFDIALPFFGDYAAVINKEDKTYKLGFINHKGKFIVAPSYDVGDDDVREYEYSVGEKKYGFSLGYLDKDFGAGKAGGLLPYGFLLYKSDKAKLQEVDPAFGTWLKLQTVYHMETSKVGDCKAILYRVPESSYFSYECDIKDGIATLEAVTKDKIRDCPAESKFIITATAKQDVVAAVSISPAEKACDLFKDKLASLRKMTGKGEDDATPKTEEEKAAEAAEAIMRELMGSDKPDTELAMEELAEAAKGWQNSTFFTFKEDEDGNMEATKDGTLFTFKAWAGEDGGSFKATIKKKIGDCPAGSAIEMSSHIYCGNGNTVPAKCKAIVPKEITTFKSKGSGGC